VSTQSKKIEKPNATHEKVVELYCQDGRRNDIDWTAISTQQKCTLLGRKCLKNRKSEPSKTIGTCTVLHGGEPIIICPHRMLQKRQVFSDCIHLLTRHEPGNEFHLISEVGIPAGNIDYVLTSVLNGKVIDFVGIELQTLDTTGTIWPARQDFLASKGVKGLGSHDHTGFGMNWKMTCKTILVQLHHKIQTFETFSSHLVLVVQDRLMNRLRDNFQFDHVKSAKIGHSMHFHSYELDASAKTMQLRLAERASTDADGIAKALGMSTVENLTLASFVKILEAKISPHTLVTV
jgi:hypothetical protein